ncbi:MAG: glycosyltransferase family 9 protein [Phycisphaeraceae bacterium]|nr:glycosyltransferase family 9 protein [Phycisphaeraceae bacterium]
MIARNEPETNVIFHQAALGDFALILPLLRAMRKPVVVVAPWSRAHLAADLFSHVQAMDIEMLEFTRLHAAGGPTHVSPMISDLFASARRIVSFVSTGDDDWARNVRRLVPHSQCCFVMPRPPDDWTGHVGAWHEKQLQLQDWALRGERGKSLAPRRGPVLIHPGSGSPRKNWPRRRYAELIKRLHDAGQAVRVVVGEVEAEQWTAGDLSRLGAERLRSLDELVAAMRQASCYVGNDSGPTHLAAQLGLPTLALFGPTSPEVWAPVGPAVTVLAPPATCDMTWLGVDAVFDAIPRP